MSFLIGILVLVAWIWSLVDIINHEFTGNNKLLWILIVILMPVVGTILYFLLGKKNQII